MYKETKHFSIMTSKKGGICLGFEVAASLDYAFISIVLVKWEIIAQWDRYPNE